MCRPGFATVLVAFALLGASGALLSDACLAAESDTRVVTAAEPVDGVLVLVDGGVLPGRISFQTDRYRVAHAHGEISVPARQVMLVARTLEDAYDQQRSRMTQPTAEAHLRLAAWCLRYNLEPQAARELIDARAIEPQSPHLALLERRLAVLGAGASSGKPPFKKPPRGTTAREELDRLAKSTADLPDGVLEQFTRKVQPVLVNNCTTAGCHQPGGKQSFQLDRAMLHGLSNRRSTLRNLAATLELVNREQPDASALLDVPRRPHGGMDDAIFGLREDQLVDCLTEWVELVAGTAAPAPAVVVEGQRKPESVYREPLAAKLVEPICRVPKGVEEAGRRADVANDSPVVAADYEFETAVTRPAPNVQYGARLTPAWQPKDPFDPEIFNRQHVTASEANGRTRDASAPATR